VAIRKAAHGALAKVTDAVEKLHFNVCVAHTYEFANALGSAVANTKVTPDFAPDFSWAVKEAAGILVRLFHPMMPHLAEECWAALGHKTLVADEAWPTLEPELLVENTITLPVQINGKKRADVTVARDAQSPEIEAAVLALDAVQRALEGKRPKKVIVVPQRIVNVVA
jgi:leucyl-tRNA synthetase